MTRFSFANVVACLALFVALGGDSLARPVVRFVTGATVKDGSLTGADIRNGSLRAVDFHAGDLPAGPQGPQGPAGASGRDGAAGTAGAPGTNGTDGKNGVGIGGSCAAGSAIRAVAGDGSVTCEPDDDTTYGVAAPLTLTSGTIGLGSCSAAGNVLRWTGSAWTCSMPMAQVADASGATSLAPSTTGTVVSTTITTPASGSIVVAGQLSWSSSSAGTTLNCFVKLDGNASMGSYDQTTAGGVYSNIAIAKRISTAAGTHTVAVACTPGSGPTVTVHTADMTVVSAL